jgi:hypothetical protein
MSSLLVICLGWCSNFVGSVSGQKQSDTGIVPSYIGVTVHNLGRKYKPLSECISSLKSLLNTMPQSVLIGQF